MENSMDRPGRVPEIKQSPESELSSSPALLQEQSTPSTMSPEQKLFRRVTWLTFLLGIMIGIWLTFVGGLWYVLTGAIPNAFYPTSPVIYRLLGPLAFTAFGFVAILLGRLQRLRRQHPAFRLSRFDLFNGSSWPLTSLSFGLLFIWLGSANVILLCFGPDPDTWGTIEMVGVVILVVSLLAELLFSFIRPKKDETRKPSMHDRQP